jgi:hypothetical protein
MATPLESDLLAGLPADFIALVFLPLDFRSVKFLQRLEFFLGVVREVRRAMFEQDGEDESRHQEQCEPEQGAEKAHTISSDYCKSSATATAFSHGVRPRGANRQGAPVAIRDARCGRGDE